MTKHLVIARYNENIDWVKNINCVDKIYLYNKGDNIDIEHIKLPNINREAHTYIHHIVTNYDQLADITFFCQGHPFDHMSGDITIENINEKINTLLLPEEGKSPFYTKGMSGCDDGVTTVLYRELFENSVPHTAFSPGAQWVAAKDNIRSKSLNFYVNIQEKLQVNRHSWNDTLYNGWSFESMWYYIFDKSVKEKQ